MNRPQQTPRQQLQQFLSALFRPAELIELRFIESWSSQGKKRSRVVQAARWLDRDELIARHDEFLESAKRTHANLYFGVCPRSHEGDADDRSIETVRCIWCDVDQTTAAEAYRRWKAAGIPRPSIVVSSGSGVHAYWLLERDLHSREERLRLTAMLPCFYRDFGGDHVQNLSRILRLPGTLNYKNARNGTPPRACSLCMCNADLRYPVNAFSKWFGQVDQGKPSAPPLACRRYLCPVGALSAGRRADAVKELVARLHTPSQDRSRRDFAVVCGLLKLGLSRDEIWELVAGVSKFESGGRTYFDRTITNAERSSLVNQSKQPPARDDAAFYFVCFCCGAKWFAPRNRTSCPRCGRTATSSERLVPPWRR